jgi:hypothetical protein
MSDSFTVHTKTLKLSRWSRKGLRRTEGTEAELKETVQRGKQYGVQQISEKQLKCRTSSKSEKADLVSVQECGQLSRLVGLGRRVCPVGHRGIQVNYQCC